MPQLFSIRVSEATSPLYQKLLFSKGYLWYGESDTVQYRDAPFLVLWDDAIAYSKSKPTVSEITSEEFLDWYATDELPERLSPLKFGSHTVVVHYDSIKVGCQTFSRKDVARAIDCMERAFVRAVRVEVTSETSLLVQSLLLSNGFKWSDTSDSVGTGQPRCGFIYASDNMRACYSVGSTAVPLQEFIAWVMAFNGIGEFSSVKLGKFTATVDPVRKLLVVGNELVDLKTAKKVLARMDDCPRHADKEAGTEGSESGEDATEQTKGGKDFSAWEEI